MWIDPSQEAWFVTVCCEPRGHNQLAFPGLWSHLRESIERRNEGGQWRCSLFLAMPDHVHFIVTFPGDFYLRKTMAEWKRWHASRHGIQWQRGFFDHRLRTEDSGVEKRNYILQNPVRAGLVEKTEDWPYVWDLRTGRR
ncbi:hypothetical protein [Luteolibacter sp. LG18]|uniref:REP-associated tyrosine transposase n=1 Tax=Luteolibacter sp. LG18 TaxID=2819286 RepID=UPI0030C6E9F5